MSDKKPIKLEDEPLWREACDLAEYLYGKLHEFPEEEKWQTQSKLRSAANDLMYYVAQGLGNPNPNSSEYDWGYARRSAGSAKTMYRFAGRQKFIDLDPGVMVRIDKVIDQIDAQFAKSSKKSEDYNRKDIEHWRKKYEISKEIENEN